MDEKGNQAQVVHLLGVPVGVPRFEVLCLKFVYRVVTRVTHI